MSVRGGGATPDSVSLAVAFHQAPSRFPDLLHGHASLPAGMGILLRLAGGASLEAEGVAAPSFVSADELQEAARFFIEQVLLAHEADHYRILGVNPGASPEEIKEHHRLLMWLYHPDRGNNVDEWRDIFATRINLAYTILRQPETRARYDTTLRRARRGRFSLPVVQRAPKMREGFTSGLSPVVARYFSQFVLGGFALLASLVVGLVYLNRQPSGAIGGGDGYNRSVSRSSESPVLLASNESKTAAVEFVPAAPVVQTPELPAVVFPAAAPSVPAVAAAGTASGKAVHPERGSAETGLRNANIPPAQPVAIPPVAVQPVAVQPPLTAKGRMQMPVATRATTALVGPPPSPAIDQEVLAALVARLSALYGEGDLEGFLALFDEGARIEHGGRARIRSDYEELFRSTVTRSLYIWDINWVRDGDLIRGEGGFQVRVIRKGENTARVYSGTIKLEVLQREGSVLINGIFHKVVSSPAGG